jgi:hypothetical protein
MPSRAQAGRFLRPLRRRRRNSASPARLATAIVAGLALLASSCTSGDDYRWISEDVIDINGRTPACAWVPDLGCQN